MKDPPGLAATLEGGRTGYKPAVTATEAPSCPYPEPRLRRAVRRLTQLADKSIWGFFTDHCPQRAASIAFYALLSLFPLAILAVAVLGLVADDVAARTRVIDFVLDNLPLTEEQGRRDIERLLDDVTRNVTGFGVLGIAVLLFAASAVMGAIRHGLNAAFNVEDTRPPAQAKVADLLLVLGFGALVTLSTALTLAERLTESLSDAVDDALPGAGGFLVGLVVDAGALVPFLMAFAIFAILFRTVPSACPHLRDTWPGVLVAAVGYEIVKTGFAVYLDRFADYGAVYASLATIVAFLIFVWLAANIALFGAEVAASWPAVRAGEYDEEEGEPILRQLWGVFKGLFVRR